MQSIDRADTESFVPPVAVRRAAKRGLELRKKQPPSKRGGLTNKEASDQGIGSGVQRASDLANGEAISLETVKRMKAFFDRHQSDKSGEGWGSQSNPSRGYQAWLLWGGDAGYAWAKRIVAQAEQKQRRSDGSGKPCGEGFIAARKECKTGERRRKRKRRLSNEAIGTAIGAAGVAVGAGNLGLGVYRVMEEQRRKDATSSYAMPMLKVVRAAIESVYGDTDGILSLESKGATLTGMFRDGVEIFDFEITPDNQISYIESQIRGDSYLIGWSLDSGNSRSGLRQDVKPKKKRCVEGKPCGNTCIAKGVKCKQKLSTPVSAGLDQLRSAIAANPRMTGLALGVAVTGVIAGGIAGGAILYVKHQQEPTPEVKQKYDKIFPKDDEFKSGKWEKFSPSVSGEKNQGSHDIYKVTTRSNGTFFVKQQAPQAVSKEVMCADVAHVMGLGENVLPARRLNVDGTPFVVNPMLEKDSFLSFDSEREIASAAKTLPRRKIEEVILFDYVVHNKDRHSGNFLFKKTGDLLLIDHGSISIDTPAKVNAKLDTERNFFFRRVFDGNTNETLSPSLIEQTLRDRKKIRKVMEYRYAGLPRNVVSSSLRALDQRFDLLQEMLTAGDTRIVHLINGKMVKQRRDSVSDEDRQTAMRVVKAVIQSVFGEFDGFPTIGIKDENIKGLFRDGDDIYEYQITPSNQLSYVEVEGRGDAIPWKADRSKKRKCQVGKPCGNTCIERGIQCRKAIDAKFASPLNFVRQQAGGTASSPGGGSQLPVGAIAAAIVATPALAFTVGLAVYVSDDLEGSAAALTDLYQEAKNKSGIRTAYPKLQTDIERFIAQKKGVNVDKETTKALAATINLTYAENIAGTKRGGNFVEAKERLAYMEKLIADPIRSEDFKASLARFRQQKKVPPYPEELAALRYYTDTVGYKEMNMTLRGQTEQLKEWIHGNVWRKDRDKRSSEQIAADAYADMRMVVSAMNSLPPYTGKAYRGLTLPPELIDSIKVGGIWDEPGFTSTTKLSFERYPGNVAMTIKSASGRDITPFEKYANQEILFAPNSSFKITSKRRVNKFGRDFWAIEMEEVPQKTLQLPKPVQPSATTTSPVPTDPLPKTRSQATQKAKQNKK